MQSLATAEARCGRIIGQRRACHPAGVTPAPVLHRPRADRGPPQRTAAPDRHQVDLGAKPAAATARCLSAGSLARQRALRPPPPSAAQLLQLPVSGLHTSADPTGTQNSPIWSPAAAERPPRSRRSYRRIRRGGPGKSVALCDRRRTPIRIRVRTAGVEKDLRALHPGPARWPPTNWGTISRTSTTTSPKRSSKPADPNVILLLGIPARSSSCPWCNHARRKGIPQAPGGWHPMPEGKPDRRGSR